MELPVKVITDELDIITRRENIAILYSCESGSRGWGFASVDSDYDVRYIYIRNTDDYISVFDYKDTIEEKINEELDISGWDIRKTLQLLYKSNAVVYEWLQSPIVYASRSNFANDLLELGKDYFQPRAITHHYLGIAKNALLDIQDNETIKLKKYFYVLRPLLAALWTVQRGNIPPMEFEKLLYMIENNIPIRGIIHSLLLLKSESNEKKIVELIPELQKFIYDTFSLCNDAARDFHKREVHKEPLNMFFRNLLLT